MYEMVQYKKYTFGRYEMLADEIKAGESANIEFKREVPKKAKNI